MLRGDSHRLYEQLRRNFPNPPAGPVSALDHVREIRAYYARLDPAERHLLLAWAKKEESGIGIIPAALSGIPFLGLIFAPFLQQFVKHVYPSAWVILWAIGSVFFLSAIYVHYRQKAYSTLHIALLEQVCNEPSDDHAAPGTQAPFSP